MSFDWTNDTTPFSTARWSQPARIVLRQVGDDQFELAEPFSFTTADGTRKIAVTADLLGRTDLASVPTFLGWFARRHGRHTPAALLHDQLVTADPARLPVDLRMPRAEADLLFRDALVGSGVPLVKAWILWTGVTLGTRWGARPWGAAGIAAWLLAAVAGTALLGYGVATGRPLLVAVALLAPVPFAALWGRHYPAGLTAGYAFWFVLFGSLPAWLAYQAYRVAEWIVIPLRRLHPRNKGVPLAAPPPFSER